jgi:transposase
MKSYSIDLRAKVLAAHDRGSRHNDIAEMFSVSQSWVRRVVQRRREHGELAPRPRIGHHPVKIDRARLAELVAAAPDATLAELRNRLGVDCSISAVWRVVRELGFSYKKRPSTPRSRTAPTSRSVGRIGSSGVPASTRGG